MATCEYCRADRSISKSTTRSMAHLPGHCHRLHPADRLPVDPLLPGGIPATAPPARRPHRRGHGPPRDTPAAAADLPDPPRTPGNSPWTSSRTYTISMPSKSAPSLANQHPAAFASVMITFRGWLGKAARVVKGMDPVPNWHICVQGSRYRTVNASRRYSAIGAFRSFSRPAHFVTMRAAPRRAASLPVRYKRT